MSAHYKSIAKNSIRPGLYPLLILFLACLFNNSVFAQTRGQLTVIKDPRIDSLIASRAAETNSPAGKTFSGTARGYRVQFFISSNRNDVYAKQAEFNQLYPDLRTYIIYKEPNYKIKAGDFRTRLEAEKLMHDLRPAFPTLFLVSEKINPPKTDNTDDQN